VKRRLNGEKPTSASTTVKRRNEGLKRKKLLLLETLSMKAAVASKDRQAWKKYSYYKAGLSHRRISFYSLA